MRIESPAATKSRDGLTQESLGAYEVHEDEDLFDPDDWKQGEPKRGEAG